MMKLKKRSLKNSYNKMQNKESVETSTQVGREEKSSQRERKVCEDEYDYYDSVAVYGEDNNEDDDDWKERSFEDIQELVNGSEKYYGEDNEE